MQAERNKISQAGQGIAADDNSRRDANVASSNLHKEGAHTMKENQNIYDKETRALPFHWIDQTANSSQINASMHSRVTGRMEDAHTMKEKNPVYEKETRTLPFHWIDRAPNRSQMNEPMHSMATVQDSFFISKPSHPILANKANNVHKLSYMSIRNEKPISSSKIHEVRDDVSTYEHVPATRTLPQYPSKSNGYFHPASYNDGVHFLGLVEQRPDHDETPIYQEALQNLGQPKLEDDLPEGHLTVSLLKHQKIALAWMVQKEKSVHCAGGILADDQGLGKTISMIALILKQIGLQSKFMTDDSHNFRTEAFSLDDDGGNDEAEAKHSGEDIHKKPVASSSENRRPAAGTLVICPASVLRQWQRELQEKVSSSSQISVLFYHGARTKDPRDLAKYDVVLTTYSIVANEVPKHSVAEDDDDEQRNMEKHGLSPEFATSKKRKETFNTGRKGKKKARGLKGSQLDYGSGPLARVRWFRVILDEAQTIKNHRTQVARACSALRAKRRWCLSGTPDAECN
ncbi:hypothetical protein HPP92_015194 [Vanilla planifolia]|uniref:Helicase ATP-binding domain-containing protein n=1 Tax=Vanilla planifolia TaxID=51239 RepID=A0A835QT34_VANPL|nr:hypothetical protein HPP92_015194 [Vanilla planifolia]